MLGHVRPSAIYGWPGAGNVQPLLLELPLPDASQVADARLRRMACGGYCGGSGSVGARWPRCFVRIRFQTCGGYRFRDVTAGLLQGWVRHALGCVVHDRCIAYMDIEEGLGFESQPLFFSDIDCGSRCLRLVPSSLLPHPQPALRCRCGLRSLDCLGATLRNPRLCRMRNHRSRCRCPSCCPSFRPSWSFRPSCRVRHCPYRWPPLPPLLKVRGLAIPRS